MEKQFDVICMGRVAVDLYSQQIGARLEDVASFAKYLGDPPGMWLTVRRVRGYVRQCWPGLETNIWAVSYGKSSLRWGVTPAI